MKIVLLFLIFFQTVFGAEELEVGVQSTFGSGFFAELGQVIRHLVYFNNKNLKRFYVDWTSEFFPFKDNPTGNGWDLYFELKTANAPHSNDFVYGHANLEHILHDQRCTDRFTQYKKYRFYRDIVNYTFNKFIKIKQNILDEVNEFYNEKMDGHYCIGVHIRYADAHKNEQPGEIKLIDYVQEVKKLIKMHKNEDPIIFIASDSHLAIERFKKEFKKHPIVYTIAFRAEKREDPHLIYEFAAYYKAHPQEFHEKKPGYFGGKMALVDCLLLSKCNVMVHTQSNVSEFATFFNPGIESVFLPKGLPPKPCGFETAPFHRLSQ